MNTESARDRILSRIRRQQHRDVALKPSEEKDAQALLQAHPRGPLPPVDADLVGHFRRMAERLQTTIDEVGSMQEAPAAVARYLAALGLPLQAAAYASLEGVPWADAGLKVEFRPPVGDDPIGLTGCFCAVAETGSLVFTTSPTSWSTAHLLPETHVVVLPVSRIVAHQEDAFDLMRKELGDMPRGFNTVSGPSRTGDIEQTIVLGAHGPYRVHVILVRG